MVEHQAALASFPGTRLGKRLAGPHHPRVLTLCLPDGMYMAKSPRPSPSTFVYCKGSQKEVVNEYWPIRSHCPVRLSSLLFGSHVLCVVL